MSLCSCYYVPTMLLWCDVHTRDIKHSTWGIFWFAWPFRYVIMSQVWTRLYKNGSLFYDHGSLFHENGSLFYENGSLFYKNGSLFYENGSLFYVNGSLFCENGSLLAETNRSFPLPLALQEVKAWVHVKAALTSLNTAFLPISRSCFKRR